MSKSGQKQFLRTRLTTKMVLIGAGGLLTIATIIKLAVTGNLATPMAALAANCSSSYTLDWGDPTTYMVTCGSVNSANWSVKGLTCYYFSPVFNVGGLIGAPNGTVDLSVRINQSGNLDDNDTAWVILYANGSVVHTDRFLGGGAPAVFTSTASISVPSAGTYQVSIKLLNDKSNELWQIKNGDVTACVHGISLLPVTLSAFTAEAINNSSVYLRWTTVAEVNNDYFTIERSEDGSQFSELKRVGGAGNSTIVNKYSFTDEKPFGGTSYYRLKQTDFNGKSETFKTVKVTITPKQSMLGAMLISPNPFNDSFIAQFESLEKEGVRFQLLDVKGMIVFDQKIIVEQGKNNFGFTAPSNLKPGNYELRIINSTSVLGHTKVICGKSS